MLGSFTSSFSVVPGWRSFYPGRGLLYGLYTEKSLILILIFCIGLILVEKGLLRLKNA